jgi:hypothetical protein
MQCPTQNTRRESGRLKSENFASNLGDNTALVVDIVFVMDNHEQHDDMKKICKVNQQNSLIKLTS